LNALLLDGALHLGQHVRILIIMSLNKAVPQEFIGGEVFESPIGRWEFWGGNTVTHEVLIVKHLDIILH
jgi:hypothetical protein